jgi:hypothetical protein
MAGLYLSAIRHYCLQCCLNQPPEVRLCPAEHCVLHKYRFGKRSQEAALTPLKAIREKCVDCCGGPSYRNTVNKCDHKDCALWAFRSGHKPKTDNLSTEEDE